MSHSLYLFTAAFPYSSIENFLELEIIYLANHFDKIYVVPQAGRAHPRPLPDNCVLIEPLYGEGISGFFEKFKDFICLRALPIELREFFRSKVYSSKRRLINWLKFSLQINRLYHNKIIRIITHQIQHDDICYFYWGVGSNLLSIILKGSCHLVSRFHGEWDLWEEMYGGYVPYRNLIAADLDCCFFISKIGKEYFDKRYPNNATEVYPLGSVDIGVSKKSDDGVIRVLSCSSVYPLKRVDLICKVVEDLANHDYRVSWTHIGGGKDFEELKKQANLINNSNLTIRLLGQIDSAAVKSYYENEAIDIFLNLSTKEGVPVSIMEAISCDIPVVATNVGATSEVVNDSCGILVSSNPTISEVTNAIVKVFNQRDKLNPRSFWFSHYNATNNYSAFAQKLYDISGGLDNRKS